MHGVIASGLVQPVLNRGAMYGFELCAFDLRDILMAKRLMQFTVEHLVALRMFPAGLKKVSKKGGVGGPVALASGYEYTYPLPNRPE